MLHEAWEAKQQRQQQKEKVEMQSSGPRVYPVKRPPHLKSKVSVVQQLQYYVESVVDTGYVTPKNVFLKAMNMIIGIHNYTIVIMLQRHVLGTA